MLIKEGLFGYLFMSSGYVLVIVLMVVSLLVSVSSEFLSMAQTNIHYIKKFNEKLQAYTIAKTGVNLSTMVLKADKSGLGSKYLSGKKGSKSTDSYYDLWAINFPPVPIENGQCKIEIIDENSKINLSILANEFVDKTPYYTMVQRFLINMGFPMDIADTLIDWVDIDNHPFPYGAESSDYYLTLPKPYNAKNDAMDSINEMLMVRLITPEIFYGLGGGNMGIETDLVDNNRGKMDIDLSMLLGVFKSDNLNKKIDEIESGKDTETLPIGKEKSRKFADYFRVWGKRSDYLDEINKININTASYRVLSSISDNATDDVVSEIIRRRNQQPFSSVDEINDLITDSTIRSNLLTVKSSIFTIKSTGIFNKTSTTIVAVYNRDNKTFYYMGEQ